MRTLCRWSALTAAALLAVPTGAQTTSKIHIDIPYQKFVLPNGLTLIVHEDHKVPIVAVNIWYHVGSKNEKPGKTGFAHLFEHLMFNGSENFNQDYFQALERLGASDFNGTTNNDRTNYFQNVPTAALDQILFLESDRMGHLLGVIDKARLDEQRGVVQNEKRQYENQPYGMQDELMTKATFPAAHPYSWTVIGSMEDLNAASVEDVREWFKSYYGAANATLVIAGDIDPDTAKAKVEKYFGWVPSGPPVAHFKEWVAKRTGTERQIAEDNVSLARLYKVWNVPGAYKPDEERLELAATILGAAKTSRLYKRLIYDEQLASTVNVFLDTREIASQFVIEVTARKGIPLSTVDVAVKAELDRFLKEGPTAKEMEIASTHDLAAFLRGVERVGGFGGKSDVLASCQVFTGDPGCFKRSIEIAETTTAEQVRDAARKWLSDGDYNLEIVPQGTLRTISKDVDRKELPKPGTIPPLVLPPIQRAQLSNGLKILLSERHETPIIDLSLQVDAGFAADQFAKAGTASMTRAMLTEGTARRSALAISEESAQLGVELTAAATLDTSTVSMSALKNNLTPSLDLFADIVLHPSFPEKDFERVQQQQIAAIQQQKDEPIQMAQRVLPGLLYGKDHAYGNPLNGTGTETSVGAISRGDVERFHSTWFRPNNATLIVVGDTKLSEIAPRLEALFGGWKAGETPHKNLAHVTPREKTSVYIVDKPGAIQSVIIGANLAPPTANPHEAAIDLMNTALGGAFTSRINMNLREDKHWSYGAFTYLVDARGQRPFLAVAPVQSDKTVEAIVEMRREMHDFLGTKPITPEELSKAKLNITLSLPGLRETKKSLVADMAAITRFGLPDTYYTTYGIKVQALERDAVMAAAEEVVRPEQMVYVIVGDRRKIEDGIRDLKLGPINYLDADGNVLP